MFEDIFPFTEIIVNFDDGDTSFIIDTETLFEYLQKAGIEKPVPGSKIAVPVDVVLSLLKPDELEKLRNYITQYLEKNSTGTV